ncbi:MAG: histidine kinase [Bryobacterales bacterium]|nr:histidine kinase [Bryobacterales bacterium]
MLEQHLVILLVKLAVSASLASVLTRLNVFVQMLLREERTLYQRLQLTLAFSIVYGAGVTVRILTHNSYQAVDLGFEASILAGLAGGYVSGLISGIVLSIPALINGEYLTMFVFAAVGVMAALVRDCAPDPAEIWRFTPFFDLSLYRLVRGKQRRRAAFHLFLLLFILFAEFLRQAVVRGFGTRAVFTLDPVWGGASPLNAIAVFATTLFTVTLPLKVWNNARNERLIEEQQRLLTYARLEALSAQINPHFLFNTLNSVSSLIRTNPAVARAVVVKLSRILRRLLRKHDNYSPLRDELEFIEDYLSIEIVRFGDKLKFVKEIDPATLDHSVPSMLLQPLVENSLRHGLGSRVEGGTIRLRSRLRDGRLYLTVEDDGVGIPEVKLATLFEQGIGVSNVNARLKVLFGDNYRMWIDSKPGEGTRTEIELPDMHRPAAAAVP